MNIKYHAKGLQKTKPSNVKSERVVPATDATVTVVRLLPALNGRDCRHTTVVPLVHDVVLQSASAMAAVGVMSVGAKLRPLIVALAPPLVGALLLLTTFQETAGAARANGHMRGQARKIVLINHKTCRRM